VTDPPYGIDFLGKAWDANTGALETYQECLRVLKPGGHIVAFSAARTYHHLAVTLEQAGFEIRDQIMWIYSSGFPKSQDIGRSIQRGIKDSEYYSKEEWEDLNGYKGMPSGDQTFGHNDLTDGQKSAGLSGKVVKVTDPVAIQWSGWGTQLKPAHEPIALARKPIKLSIAKNCQKHGVGALNIDACRVGDEVITTVIKKSEDNSRWYKHSKEEENIPKEVNRQDNVGRFPSNVIGDIPDYQKYFYCPKVSRRERHIGHETPPPMFGDQKGAYDDNGERYAVGLDARGVMSEKQMLEIMGGHYTDPNEGGKSIWLPEKGVIYAHGLKHEYSEWCKANNKDPGNVGNNHPTVKPIELMKYLIRLITPPGGTVLDPFNGSGSTGCAAVELGHPYIGCELDPAYVEIATKRIEAWHAHTNPTTFRQLFDRE